MKTVRQNSLDLADQVLTQATLAGALHFYTEDEVLNGRQIQIQGRSVINFGSCSYLGLEKDPRTIQGCIAAAQKHGTQFSSSRAYISDGLYMELESLLVRLFNAHCLVMPTTSLGHISALPALINPGDAIILDHQVHASVQTACQINKARGDCVEMIRHNRLDELEDRIKVLRAKHRHIWYCLDGVYSMFGDLAPMPELYQLLDKYPQLHLYIDDAHGFSWSGRNGRGSVLGPYQQHERMVVALSLNKAFAAAGGVLVFPTLEMKRRVRACGGGVIFSGPIQPPMLGAAIASAKIHLSGEIESLQATLQERIQQTRALIEGYNLPDVGNADSPIFYIGVGQPKVGYNLVKRLMAEGFYVNIGLFPAVPLNKTGIRFTTTVHHTLTDLRGLVNALSYHLPLALAEQDSSLNDVRRIFKLPSNTTQRVHSGWQITEYDQAAKLPGEWDTLMSHQGTYDRNRLSLLERSFAGQPDAPKEHQWQLKYLILRDEQQQIVLATMATQCWIKSDMFSSQEMSIKAEKQRQKNPYQFCSQVIMQGSGLTEGPHLYLNRQHPHWQSSVSTWLKWLVEWRENSGAESVILRDFQQLDTSLDELLQGKSFLRVKLPDSHQIAHPADFDEPVFFQRLSHDHRRHWRKAILPFQQEFHCKRIASTCGWQNQGKLEHWYQLYHQVCQRALEINTFTLPKSLFAELMRTPGWEALELYAKDHEHSVAVVFQYWNGKTLNPMVMGMDYRFQSRGVYRQALCEVMKRAKLLNSAPFSMGFGASLEKRRLGASAKPTYAYVQATDNFNLTALDSMSD